MVLKLQLITLLVLALTVYGIYCHRVGSCTDRCGGPQDRRQQCQCDSECELYSDCCEDFGSICNITLSEADPTLNSCQGRCGAAYDEMRPCNCNTKCGEFRNCCDDYIDYCLPTEPKNSCLGKCGEYTSNSTNCYCNKICTAYGDCCGDYAVLCETEDSDISDKELLQMGNWLWTADRYKLRTSEFTINIQNQTMWNSSDDVAADRLFTFVNESVLEHPSYALFIAILDNFEEDYGKPEPKKTSEEQEEVEAFLNHTIDTAVMNVLRRFLLRKKRIDSKTDLLNLLRVYWFREYGRSSKFNFTDTSGFEHVFVGEKKSTKVTGFHNWVHMYLLEKENSLNYLGYNHVSKPRLLDAHFTWDGLEKKAASMFIGMSPQFDMALYTMCMIARPNKSCFTSIRHNIVNVQTYRVNHADGVQVGTAFPVLT